MHTEGKQKQKSPCANLKNFQENERNCKEIVKIAGTTKLRTYSKKPMTPHGTLKNYKEHPGQHKEDLRNPYGRLRSSSETVRNYKQKQTRPYDNLENRKT